MFFMSKIAIATDSNSGITQAEAATMGISVVPMPFYIDDKLYFEGVDISQEEFYKVLATGVDVKTSQPGVEQLTGLWDELLKEYEQLMPRKAFMTEFRGQFIDGGGLVFDFFRECQKEVKLQLKDKLYVGIDWSNQANKDYTVVSVLNQNGEQVKLNYWNDLTPLKQIDKVYGELEPYLDQIQAIVCETNSLGTPYTDLLTERLQDRHKNKIKEFVTSNSSKNDLVGKMQVALEQGSISLLPDNKQEREFSYYACEYNPQTKTITYNAPSGLHDDTVMATMFALYGFNEYKTTGVYSIGGGNLRRR
jgi:hypothetical protein